MAEDNNMPGVASEDMDAEYDFEDKVGVDQDLTGDGGVVKTILRVGEGWESPESGDHVTVHYVGTLLDGAKFDSSRDRDKTFDFPLGTGKVIKAWDVGVASMKKGELARLTCKPEYAYGAGGMPPTIPPEATLVFEVELLSWKNVKDITGDGGVIKTVVCEGQGWQKANPADEAVLTYTARIVDPPAAPAPKQAAAAAAAAADGGSSSEDVSAAVVASSPEGGAVFTVADAPCSGLSAALKTMKPGEEVHLLIKPDYAVGLADVPEGKLLQIDATLTSLHRVDHPAPGLTRKTLSKPDSSYEQPNAGSTVKLVVEARSLEGGGEVYEAAHEVELVLDEEQAPEALELALMKMCGGEHALITATDPALIAAPEGAVVGCGVPPGAAAVVYDVTLTSVVRTKERWQMNNQDKLTAALSHKEKGNAAYKAGRLVRAQRQYSTAVELASSIAERDLAPNPTAQDAAAEGGVSTAHIMAQAKDVKKACALNLAAVALKLTQWGEAVKQATQVLELDPGNIKALYRRAQAHMSLNECVEAECDIKGGLMSHPDNTDLAALYRKLKVQMRELNKKDAKLYGRMFAALGRSAAHSDQGAAAAATANGADAPTAAAVADGPTAVQEDTPAAAAAAPIVEAAA